MSSLRMCGNCSAPFKPNRRNGTQIKAGYVQTFCSVKCAASLRRRYPDRKARKRAENARRRERRGIVSVSRECKGCGAAFVVKAENQICCSPACKARAISRLGRQPVNCARCDKPFVPIDAGRRRFCSANCLAIYHRNRSGSSHRKRARYHGVPYEYINTLKVMERDSYRCQVCGRATPKRLRGTTDERAPELDHRIPMAMGGGHIWPNVQCACRRCNADKGGTRASGQTNLFDLIIPARKGRL
jgi:5-methylcytosine-specific restriction endonuclease McrA